MGHSRTGPELESNLKSDSIYAWRRINLNVLLEMGYDGSGYLLGVALKLINPCVIDRLAHPSGPPIAEDFARFIESATEWPQGWLDMDPTAGDEDMLELLAEFERAQRKRKWPASHCEVVQLMK